MFSRVMNFETLTVTVTVQNSNFLTSIMGAGKVVECSDFI